MTPQIHGDYFVPLRHDGLWKEVLNSDGLDYGGSGVGNLGVVRAQGGGARMTLPPLATIMLEFEG